MATNYSTIQEANASLDLTTNTNAIIVLKAEASLIELSWKNSPSPRELAECAQYLNAIIKEYNVEQFLHDIRNIDYVSIDLHRSIAKVFCPQLIEAGIVKMVHLANYAIPDLMVIDQIVHFVKQQTETGKNVKFETCTTVEGAYEWLKYVKTNQVATEKTSITSVEVISEPKVLETAKESSLGLIIKSFKEKASLFLKIYLKRKAFYTEI